MSATNLNLRPNFEPNSFEKIVIVVAFILLIILCFSGCITEKKRLKICATCAIKTEVRDSIIERVSAIPFDTTLWLVKHNGKEQSFTNCDSLYDQLLRHHNRLQTDSNGIKSTIERKGNRIVFKCEADSLKHIIRLMRLEKSKVEFKTVTREVPARCEKEHRTWIDGLYKRGFWIMISALIGFFGFKYFRGRMF